PAAAHVRHVDARPDLAQAQLHEGVLRAQPHRLAGVAVSPLALVPDHDAALGIAQPPVDPVEPDRADQLAAVLQDDPPDDAVRVLGDLLEELLLLAQGRWIALYQVAGDLHVGKPALVGRRPFGPRRLQPDTRAFDDGAKHGTPTLARG